MPLSRLDPATAAWAERAYVREEEGPWQRLERAPLNRRGWAYGVLLGAGQISSRSGDVDPGFLGHIQLGYFPSHQLGLLFDIALGWRDNERRETVFDSRYALELELLPFSAGILHGGAYGQLGLAAQIEDRAGDRGRNEMFAGGGALLQLELTTRLAITGRAGLNFAFDEPTSEFSLGLSVY
jgi:hypothetical protein